LFIIINNKFAPEPTHDTTVACAECVFQPTKVAMSYFTTG